MFIGWNINVGEIGEECNHENKVLIINETKDWAMKKPTSFFFSEE
jgi:hypothetical protein